MSATVILSPQTAAAEVCHDEQMEIWSHEIVVGLGMAGLLKDPISYDELGEVHSVIKQELRSIIEMAFDHPEGPELGHLSQGWRCCLHPSLFDSRIPRPRKAMVGARVRTAVPGLADGGR